MGVGFTTVKYLETPPSAKELKQLFKQAGLRPQEAIRTREPAYDKYIAGKNLTDDH